VKRQPGSASRDQGNRKLEKLMKELIRITFMMAVGIFAISSPAIAGNGVKPVRIGITNEPAVGDAFEVVVNKAKQEGIAAEIVVLNDWTTPNEALRNGDIDLNYFQNIGFLENAKRAAGYDFVPIAVGTGGISGLYSVKIKKLDQLRDRATIGVLADPVNLGRSLRFLQDAGLIKLRDSDGFPALTDVAENPKHLNLLPLEYQIVLRTLPDVDAAVTGGSQLKQAGIDPDSALAYSKYEKRRALLFVVRRADAENPRIRRIVEIYQTSPEVRDIYTKYTGKLVKFTWLDTTLEDIVNVPDKRYP
jgi:D-methionine transport system substrate-binding protein